ncbi:hypothetical protein CHLNCDRAFT_141775 [Chlorella variabilis]|uniref:Cupin type-1 domain-containing protein n=1 Tax=Chlorella variabilis TaxID=554065 RepID=E1ZTK5_CHLVA|nr:hypothetical protein CHLNCDRAFT_141775 [Chlorella variabilis]EFN50856.1 hypothetical protein CHLNCDRAFT_141775 [Chlorella variabilis]|eukprot:XP_005842958.1 hypothetical protein CHLNCDRAFT_141775 [Chlorella variabilis]
MKAAPLRRRQRQQAVDPNAVPPPPQAAPLRRRRQQAVDRNAVPPSPVAVAFTLEPCTILQPHIHPHAEFAFPIKGKVTFSVVFNNNSFTEALENTQKDVGPGGFAVFPTGTLHVTQNEHCVPATIMALFASSNPSASFYPFTEPQQGTFTPAILPTLLPFAAAGAPLSHEDVRQLLHTALRLRQGRGQSSALPEQLLALFQQCYHELGRPERLALFRSLTATFGIQAHELDTAVAAWQHLRQQQQQQAEQQKLGGEVGPTAGPAPDQLFKAAAQLSAAATPLYTRLLSPLSQQPGGIKFLVDMRGELLQAIQEHPSGAAPLRALSEALRGCLAEWFGAGELQDGVIAAREAVHEFGGWRDLKSRLSAKNRRVYAFFHNAMPEEPLVVLHTALAHKVAHNLRQLLPHLDPGRSPPGHNGHRHAHTALSERTWEEQPRLLEPHHPYQATLDNDASLALPFGHQQAQQAQRGQPPSVAVFYSISSTQRGLTGVAHQVQSEFPSVTTLCTLSPLPGFADWLRLQLARVGQGLLPSVPLLLPGEAEQLEEVAAGHLPGLGWTQHGEHQGATAAETGKGGSSTGASSSSEQQKQQQQQAEQERAAVVLGWALADDAWLHSSRLEAAVEPVLMRLAAHYLLLERRRGLALDPVANFHLRNGAAVMQLNWHADTSPAGLRRSHGIMVNYQYELDRLHDNNRAYLVDSRVPAAPAVEALLGPHG